MEVFVEEMRACYYQGGVRSDWHVDMKVIGR